MIGYAADASLVSTCRWRDDEDMNVETLYVRVASTTMIAEGIVSLELRSATGDMLPPFTAGAHVDLHLGNGLIRSYSLVNRQDERHRYVIAVNLDRSSRGGSAFIHDCLKQGVGLTIGVPRNNFPLAEEAARSLLIAGGIGITPLWCMIQRLIVLKRNWMLYYGARTRKCAAFVDELDALRIHNGAEVSLNFDDESGGRLLDMDELLANTPPGTHLYCCGPLAMLESFERAISIWPQSQVHTEYFSAKAPRGEAGGFTLVLARSGLTFEVPAGKTILRTLIEHGIDVPYSCQEGICGTCETRVLEGVPEHRDLVLSQEAREGNQTIMICCSGSRSERLVLDL